MVSRYSRSNAMQRANDIQFGNTSLILALSLVCPNRSVTPIAKCNSTLAHKALLQISSCCCRMLSLGLGRCRTPPDYRYQSLSMASFAPPLFLSRLCIFLPPVFLSLIFYKYHRHPITPPTYAGDGGRNAVNSINIPRKSTSAFRSVDIAEPFYSVTHNALALTLLG